MICTKCKLDKPITEFAIRLYRKKKRLYTHCTPCRNIGSKLRYEKNPDYFKGYANRRNQELRKQILVGYGGKCVCCYETEPLFLALDHVNNDGFKSRKGRSSGGSTIYRRAIEQNFPPIYQLLCHNCNMGKHLNKGICPHQKLPAAT